MHQVTREVLLVRQFNQCNGVSAHRRFALDLDVAFIIVSLWKI